MSPTAVTPDQFSTFGELLRYLRRQARITQRELAIAVGYSDTQISRIEQNQRVPDSTTITALFVPALYIEQEPKWVARLLELAKAANVDGVSGIEIMAALPTGTVTFLFTDIEGSTHLARQYPDAMPALLARHHEILNQCIQAHNGYAFQIVGDSFCAAFHSASEALDAALDAQRLLNNEAWSPAPIKVRMGIHTGTAHLQDASQVLRYSGYATLALAQRIMSAGHGGQILVSKSTYELMRDTPLENAQLVDMGRHRLKDALQAEQIYQLTVPDLPSEFSPLNTIKLFNHNLPAQLTSFIGREKEIAEIKQAIEKYRLVTLTGPGGTGKTRLSLQLAAELLESFPDGTWLVEFAPLSDPALVPQVVVTTLGLIEQAGRSALMILTDFLQAKRALLILDNCEHLIQACAQLAEALLRACPNLHILTTSREALGIDGETLYLVPPLTTPDPLHATLEALPHYEAVQLFIERAQSSLTGFTLIHENAPAIAQVCRQLDGIPLALELAAARVKVLRVEEITARLDDRFNLLTGGARTALPRHQTLQALIDWSHDLLPEPERLLLRRLSVFAGGWSLEAAESVCAEKAEGKRMTDKLHPSDVLDLLTSLVNKSLILVEREQGQETRYRMLETIRQYAREKLWEAGEGEFIRQRHLAYFVDLAERAEPNLRAWDMVMWLDRLEAEHDNIRAALAWALESDIEAELRLTSALWWFWHIRGYKSEGGEWLERALSIEAMERGGKPLTPDRALIRGKALYVAGFLRLMFLENDKGAMLSEESLTLFRELGVVGRRGMAYTLWNLSTVADQKQDLRRAKALLEESLAVFQELDDRFGIAQCLSGLGFYALGAGNYEQARMLWEEHLALRQEIGDKDGNALALRDLGVLASQQGDYKQATIHCEASLALFRELKNKWAMSLVLSLLGRVAGAQGNYGQATTILAEALALGRDLGDKFSVASMIIRLGSVAGSEGDYGRASKMHEEALNLFRELGNQIYSAIALWNLGLVAMAQGDAEQAANKFEEVLAVSRGSGDKFGTALALYGLGKVAKSRGDYASARALHAEGIVIHRETWVEAYHLEAFAVLSAAQNQMERAARLFRAAENFNAPLRSEMSAAWRAEHDQAVAIARAALGKEAFAAAWAEGKAMTIEEAVAYALRED